MDNIGCNKVAILEMKNRNMLGYSQSPELIERAANQEVKGVIRNISDRALRVLKNESPIDQQAPLQEMAFFNVEDWQSQDITTENENIETYYLRKIQFVERLVFEGEISHEDGELRKQNLTTEYSNLLSNQ